MTTAAGSVVGVGGSGVGLGADVGALVGCAGTGELAGVAALQAVASISSALANAVSSKVCMVSPLDLVYMILRGLYHRRRANTKSIAARFLFNFPLS